ncbi:hypothetical protein VMCG_10650 [Cytospora schulzeri]|uniref:Uncharacterized protein n=1 Tax=Cytospora schulzeri TaxID=448051 RepID=A0A423VBE0_9PEZI|nr:hypothetical protein VMCG_10650 [Valsa malicola]
MAESLSPPIPPPRDGDMTSVPATSNTPAAFKWAGADGKPSYLCDSDANPTGFLINYNHSDKTVHFRLHFSLDLLRQKGPRKARTPVYIYIQPDRIRSIVVLDGSSKEGDEVQEKNIINRLGPNPLCFQLDLQDAPDLIVPPFPLWPSKKSHRAVLHAVGLLAKQTALTVYVSKDCAWSSSQLASLCQAVSEHQLGLNREAAELSKLYNGQGGKLLSPESLSTSSYSSASYPNLSPPSYGELEPGPPGPPLYGSVQGSSSSNKRQRKSSADEDEHEGTSPGAPDIVVIEHVCRKMLAEHQAIIDQSQRAEREQLEKRISFLEETLRAGLGQLKTRVGLVEARCEEISTQVDELAAQVEESQELVGEHDRHVDERVCLEVEDRVIGIRMDLEDFVKDELTSTAEAIRDQIMRANVFIEFNDE